MAAITVLKENVPQGPFTREQVSEKLRTGEITLQSLAFIEGLTQWTPLRDVLARVDASSPVTPPAPPVTSPAPTLTSQPMNTGSLVSSPPPASPGYSYAVTMQPPEHLVYAGFWLRFAAVFVDGLILLPLSIVAFLISLFIQWADDDTIKLILGIVYFVYVLIVMVVQWLYFALLEAGVHQATWGKRLLGIQVTNREGKQITFGRASGRYFGKIISGLALYIGFMMAGWTKRKQALHDMLADTLVVRKSGQVL